MGQLGMELHVPVEGLCTLLTALLHGVFLDSYTRTRELLWPRVTSILWTCPVTFASLCFHFRGIQLFLSREAVSSESGFQPKSHLGGPGGSSPMLCSLGEQNGKGQL